MTNEQIIALQKRVGTVPDGFWGPKSIAACQSYIRNLMQKTDFPKGNEKAMNAYYGQVCHPELETVELPAPLYLYGDKKTPVKKLMANKKCAASLVRVFQRIHKAGLWDELKSYDGVFNPRPMRGGTSWSIHAWAAAIDLNASTNGNNTSWPTKATMPIEIIECFAREGWVSAGVFWGRDAMHFQATQI